MVIRKEDLNDLDIVDSIELASDGYSVYLTTSLVSTNISGNIVTINLPSDGEGLITGRDHLAQEGDRVRLVGTSGGTADGYFIIETVLTETSFSTTATVASSTGGTIYFMHPVGAKSVGFDPTGLITITARNVQDAIKELFFSSSGVTENEHENLDTLTHNIAEDGYALAAYTGNRIDNYTIWTNSSMITKIREYQINYVTISCKTRVNYVVTKQYDVAGSVKNTLTETISYSGNKIISVNAVKT